ncbi:MAG: cytochrome c biogenesis protein CcsA [Anaerolineae bacterium]|nr:MAG: cytochrome c biogenesis protein CcsA [Anaerolineae bacterium]
MRADRITVLNVVTVIAILVALYLALIQAPDPANVDSEAQRYAQRIIYFHISNAWVGFFAFLVTFLGSVLYLWKGERRWDILALSSVEVGVAFMTASIITGSIWAKPAWNTWWTWDPRLTTSTITWLIYVSYLMLRSALDDPARRARFAAVYGVAGFVSVPITFFAIRWWRTIHPVLFDASNMGLSPNMRFPFFFSLGAFTLLYFAILIQRIRVEQLADRVARLKASISASGRSEGVSLL